MMASAAFSVASSTVFVSLMPIAKRFCGLTMPKLSPDSVTLLDGEIVLSRRDGSARWQARFKNGSRWIRVTTKEKNSKTRKKWHANCIPNARSTRQNGDLKRGSGRGQGVGET